MLLRKNKNYKKLNEKIRKSKPEKTYDLGLLNSKANSCIYSCYDTLL